MTSQDMTVLSSANLFHGISEPEIRQLFSCLGIREQRFCREEQIWHTGDTIRECALVLSGAVRAESIGSGGRRTILAVHRPGGVLGDILMAAQDFPSPIDLVAAEDSRLIFLPFDSIMGGCSRCCPGHGQLRVNLISEIAQKYWKLHGRVHCLSARTIRQRLARYLLEQYPEQTFCLGITREELADILGVNRSALCRELGNLRSEGLLDFYRDSFKVPDWEKIRQVAEP